MVQIDPSPLVPHFDGNPEGSARTVILDHSLVLVFVHPFIPNAPCFYLNGAIGTISVRFHAPGAPEVFLDDGSEEIGCKPQRYYLVERANQRNVNDLLGALYFTEDFVGFWQQGASVPDDEMPCCAAGK